MRAIAIAMLLLVVALSGGCDLDLVAGVPVVYDVYEVVPAPVVYEIDYVDPCYYGCYDYVEVDYVEW